MKRELLFSVTKKDLDITFFSGTGAGGQHRNKHQNCVRMYHPDSDVRTTGQSNRERGANLREAFNSLVSHPKFKVWHSRKTMEMLSNETIEEKVAKAMEPQNIRVEGKSDGKWVELNVRS